MPRSGEQNHNAVLTKAIVSMIKYDHANEGWLLRELALVLLGGMWINNKHSGKERTR